MPNWITRLLFKPRHVPYIPRRGYLLLAICPLPRRPVCELTAEVGGFSVRVPLMLLGVN